MRHFSLILILLLPIKSLFGAAAESSISDPLSFRFHVHEKLAYICKVADSCTQYLNELSRSARSLNAFCSNIGYPSEIPDRAPIVSFIQEFLTDDSGLWAVLKRTVSGIDDSVPALEKADVAIRRITMEYFKFRKETEELQESLKDPTKIIIVKDASGTISSTRGFKSPAEIFMKAFSLHIAREESEILQILATDLLTVMPAPYRKHFTAYLPFFSINHKSGESKLSLGQTKRTKEIVMQINLSNGYGFMLPINIKPNFSLVPLNKVLEDGSIVEEKAVCALQIKLPTGPCFVIRSLPIAEVSRLVAETEKYLLDAPPIPNLSSIYPKWESEEWKTVLGKNMKSAKPKALSDDDRTPSVVVASAVPKGGKNASKNKEKKVSKKETDKPEGSKPRFVLNPDAPEFIPSGISWDFGVSFRQQLKIKWKFQFLQNLHH